MRKLVHELMEPFSVLVIPTAAYQHPHACFPPRFPLNLNRITKTGHSTVSIACCCSLRASLAKPRRTLLGMKLAGQLPEQPRARPRAHPASIPEHPHRDPWTVLGCNGSVTGIK
jgi:hypothetical protein